MPISQHRGADALHRPPRDLPRRDAVAGAPHHERRDVAGDDGGDADGPARQEGNHRRDHRRGAGDARVRHQGGGGRPHASGGHRRHRRRQLAQLQHQHLQHVRGRGRRRARQQARQPRREQQVRQCRRARGAGRADVADAAGHQPLHRRHRHRLHVRAQPPPGDEERGAGAQGTGRAHHLQHPGAADQPGRCAEHPDGRVPPRPGGHPGARAAAPGRRACGGGLRPRRHGRGLAGRGHDGRRIPATAASTSTRSTPRTSA